MIRIFQRSFSSNPSKYVHGVTSEMLQQDPALAAYFAANFENQRVKEQEVVAKKKTEEEYFPRNIRPLSTYLREDEGSRRSRLLRYHQMIPGLIHGGNAQQITSRDPSSKIKIQTPWHILEKELGRYHRNFESRVYDLTIYRDQEDAEGVVERVIPQSVQRHPVQNKIYCANFCRYHAGRPIPLPIKQVNQEESPALKREAYIIPITRKIWCLVDEGVDIPEALELECTGLTLKDVIRKDRILLPEGVKFAKKTLKRGDDFIIGVVQGRARDAADDDDDVS